MHADASLDDDTAATCMLAMFESIDFEGQDFQQTTVVYPIVFSPGT